MMEHGTIINVEYGGVEYGVSGITYVDIEDKCEAIDKALAINDSEKEAAKEWIKYKCLFDEGHFIPKPSVEEPKLSKVFDGAIDDVEDVKLPVAHQPASKEVWTQSRILAERERLLRKEEALLKKEKIAFEKCKIQKDVVKNVVKNNTRQFYHPDGTPYSTNGFTGVLLIIGVVIGVLLLSIVWCTSGS